MDIKDMAAAGIAMLLGVVGWFLRSKDEAQAKQISALWEKHDEDVRSLQELRERIAREHYVKAELDMRFQRLEDAFRDGFRDMGDKLDKISSLLLDHLAKK